MSVNWSALPLMRISGNVGVSLGPLSVDEKGQSSLSQILKGKLYLVEWWVSLDQEIRATALENAVSLHQ